MNALISRLISDAIAPVGKMSARLFKKAVLFLVAAGCLFVCLILLTTAFFIFVQPLVGSAIAALVTGSLYLGVAGICIVIVVASPGSTDEAKPVASESMTDTKRYSARKLAFPSNIDETVAPILDVLRDAGLERERLALVSGMEIAKKLHPFSLAALSVAAGFVLGRILKQRSKLG